MISKSDFHSAKIFKELVLGKVAKLALQKNNGSLLKTNRRANFRLMNEALGATLVLTAAATLTEEDNGKTIMLNSATGFTVTLPPIDTGYKFKCLVSTQPTSGNHVILSQTADIIIGRIVDMAGTGDNALLSDQINFVASQAVVGDYVIIESLDASAWWVNGIAAVAAGVTATG